MEFGWTPEQAEARERIIAFLAEHLPPNWEEMAIHGPGSRPVIEFSKHFCPKLSDAGMLVPHWPAQWGGHDGTAWEHFIIGEELWAAGEPRGAQYMNVNWLGPVLMKYAGPKQLARYMPPIIGGQAIWCQGFSEPSGGSDLAALKTQAVPVVGGYRVNGAKIWTSYAGLADHCFLLARTSAERKKGILILLVDMKSAGISVREIPSLIGRGDIHEVFFDDVFVPDECRLGEAGQAWEIINYGLQAERIGIARYAFSRRILDLAAQRLRSEERLRQPHIEAALGRAAAYCEAARMMVYRVVSERAHGRDAGAYANLARLSVIRADRHVNDFLMTYAPEGMFSERSLQRAHHQRAIAAGIAAGAAEVHMNIAAYQYLNLPRA